MCKIRDILFIIVLFSITNIVSALCLVEDDNGISSLKERERLMEEFDKKIENSDSSSETNYVQKAKPVDENKYEYKNEDGEEVT